MRAVEEKGSTISGLEGDKEGSDALGCGAEEEKKGCDESRRMAWVIVGWKRPPWGEYIDR